MFTVEGSKHGNPIHAACSRENEKMAVILLDRGVDVNDDVNERGTPLHAASRFGHIGVARLLISKGANVNAVSEKAGSPLHTAILRNQPAMAEYLISAGAAVNIVDLERGTPLHVLRSKSERDGKINWKKLRDLLVSKGAQDLPPPEKGPDLGHVYRHCGLRDCSMGVRTETATAFYLKLQPYCETWSHTDANGII